MHSASVNPSRAEGLGSSRLVSAREGLNVRQSTYFVAGRFLEETPPGEDVHFVTAYATYRF